jgi:hypothetical protein
MLSSVMMRSAALFYLGCMVLLATEDRPKVDNSVVHVVEVVNAPHAKHSLPPHDTDRILVSLDTGNTKSLHDDRHSNQRHWTPGEVQWIPAGESLENENTGQAPLRFVEIDLKTQAIRKPTERKAELDPVLIDPKHNVLLIEKAQVRVFRSWREPGATEKMHEHSGAGRLAILLTGLDATVKTADGSISPTHASAGDVLWSGSVTHATTNLAAKKFDMIVVEVK